MTRIDYYKEKPEILSRFRALTKDFGTFALDAKLRALVETRVSQINGCAYCTDLHTREARALGEDQRRLDSLPVWKDSCFFDPREKAALAWAESLTLLPSTHAADPEYLALAAHFPESEIVELSLVISLSNFWNRIAAGFRKQPDPLSA